MPTHAAHDAAHDVVRRSHFANQPFTIDDYIAPDDTTCPPRAVRADGVLKGSPALPGGCTRDLVHRFYQEQYQINGGQQDRYVTGSDAVGLTMGVYDTKELPIYQYLHSRGAPNYVVADNFFQAAFGGSFLNHQWLIAARAPLDTSGATPAALNSLRRRQRHADQLPAVHRRPVGRPRRPAHRWSARTRPPTTTRPACGDFAVNTDAAVEPAARRTRVEDPAHRRRRSTRTSATG